jgi:hypothetical protein
VAVSAAVLLRNEQASISARTGKHCQKNIQQDDLKSHTLQSINRPLFELLEGDLCGGRDVVEIQSIRVILLLVGWGCELLLLVVQSRPPLGVNTIGVLSNHFDDDMNPNPVAMSVVDST